MLHGGDIYSHKILMDKDREGLLLDYSVNTNPLGMPEPVKAALRDHVEEYHRYPDPACRELRAALSRYEGVSEDRICCGNGAADLIFRICLAQKPRRVLVCAPAFSEYERAAALAGGEVTLHRLDQAEGFALTRRYLEDLVPGLDMAFLCNPNNPTGRLIDPGLLAEILRRCRELGILLVMDECFLPFTEAPSLALRHAAKAASADPCLVVVKALTKTFSMAGLRLGYAIGPDSAFTAALDGTGQRWSVSTPAQVAACAALGCLPWLEQSREIIATERRYLAEALRELGFTVFDSDANFMLFRSARPLLRGLMERGILIRDCSSFHGLDGSYYRCCVKRREQNELFIAALREAWHDQE
jgi:threonine-phosphate decarboxylase